MGKTGFYGVRDSVRDPMFLTGFTFVHFMSGLIAIPIYAALVLLKVPEGSALIWGFIAFTILHCIYELKDLVGSYLDDPPGFILWIEEVLYGKDNLDKDKHNSNSWINSLGDQIAAMAGAALFLYLLWKYADHSRGRKIVFISIGAIVLYVVILIVGNLLYFDGVDTTPPATP